MAEALKSVPPLPARPRPLPRAKLLTPAGPQATTSTANVVPPAPANQDTQSDLASQLLPPGLPSCYLPTAASSPACHSAGQALATVAPQPLPAYAQPYIHPGTIAPAAPAAYPAWSQPGTPGQAPVAYSPAAAMTPYPGSGTLVYGAPLAYAGSAGSSAVPQSDSIALIPPRIGSRTMAALAARRKLETRNILLLGVGSVVVMVAALVVYAKMTTTGTKDPSAVAQQRPQLPTDPEAGDTPVEPQEPVEPPPGSSEPTTPPGTPPLIPEPPALEPVQPPVKLTKQQLVELGRALEAAKAALARRDFEQAEIDIARAESLAGQSEHQPLVERLREVAAYVRQFHEAVVLAVQGFQVGDEILVGNSTMARVVKTGTAEIVVRVGAQNRAYSLAELPVGLALAIVDYRLSADDPVNLVIRGAYLAIDQRQDPDTLAKAKGYWERAQAAEVEIGHLMPFLTDDYQLVDDE